MRIEIVMPELGEDGPDEGAVSFWMVDPGEAFKEGDDLVEILTDKATFTVPAPADGKLVDVVVNESEKAKVGAVLAVMESDR